jgi:hypothetical protein
MQTPTDVGLEFKRIANWTEIFLELGMWFRGNGEVRICISSKDLNHTAVALSSSLVPVSHKRMLGIAVSKDWKFKPVNKCLDGGYDCICDT